MLKSLSEHISDLVEPNINDLSRIMHWISFLFRRLRFFLLLPSLRKLLDKRRSETITNFKLLTLKKTTNNRSSIYGNKRY